MEGTKIRLWRQTNTDGKSYLVGSMSNVTRLVVIENDRKREAKDPDAYAYIVANRGPIRLPTDAEKH